MSLLEVRLPNGREWGRVGDAYAVRKKPRGLDLSLTSEIPFAAMSAIPQDGAYSPNFTSRKPDQIVSGTYFECGDVLVGKITPSFENGKQALAQELDTPFGYATTEIIPLHPLSERYDPRFLFFYLLHPDVRHHISERMEGSTGRKRVPEDVLLDLPIPSLKSSEQTEIANALEVIQHSKIVEVATEQSACEIRRSAIQMLFTRGSHNETHKKTEIGLIPESWEVVKIGQLFEIVQGLSLKGNLSDDGDGVPFLRTSNVYWNRVDLSSVSRMNVDAERIKDRILEPGDLLVCEGGEIGRAAVWNGDMAGCIYQNHLHRLRAKQADRIDTKFTAAWLEEGFLHRNIYAGVGNRTTIPNLSRARLAELPIPCPPLEEQREIVAILDAIDRKIGLHRRKRTVLDDLFKTLLHKLLTGEIRAFDLDLPVLENESKVEMLHNHPNKASTHWVRS